MKELRKKETTIGKKTARLKKKMKEFNLELLCLREQDEDWDENFKDL